MDCVYITINVDVKSSQLVVQKEQYYLKSTLALNNKL
jgi:hypothetical protein